MPLVRTNRGSWRDSTQEDSDQVGIHSRPTAEAKTTLTEEIDKVASWTNDQIAREVAVETQNGLKTEAQGDKIESGAQITKGATKKERDSIDDY